MRTSLLELSCISSAVICPWPASKKTAKQLIDQNFMVSKKREYHRYTKQMFHNFGSNPLRAELARSGAILVNSP